MSENKKTSFVKDFSWKRTVITVILMLVTALAVGGVLWWVMERNSADVKEASDRSIQELSDQVSAFKERVTESEKKETTATSAATSTTNCKTATGNCLEDVETFCLGLYPGLTNTYVSIMENQNGIFANCSLDNGFLIAKKVNNTWTRLWAGNGTIAESLCTQYRIPNKMSGGVCNY